MVDTHPPPDQSMDETHEGQSSKEKHVPNEDPPEVPEIHGPQGHGFQFWHTMTPQERAQKMKDRKESKATHKNPCPQSAQDADGGT